MKCPCCDKELTAAAVARVRQDIAALEREGPAPGSLDRVRLMAMRSLVEKYEDEGSERDWPLSPGEKAEHVVEEMPDVLSRLEIQVEASDHKGKP